MTLFSADSGPLSVQRTILPLTTVTPILDASISGGQSIGKIHVCNKTATPATINIEAFDGTTGYSLEHLRSVPSGTSFEYRDDVLPQGYSLRASASIAGLHVTVVFALGSRAR